MKYTNTLLTAVLAAFLSTSEAVARIPNNRSFVGVRFAEGLDGDEYLGKDTDISMLSGNKAGEKVYHFGSDSF